jgi:hypothetical protein
MTDLEKINVLINRKERIVAGLKYAARRTQFTSEENLVLREEEQNYRDLVSLEREMKIAAGVFNTLGHYAK